MTEIDPWKVAKAAAEDHFFPRMDGTVAPDHVQQAFIDGFAEAVEQLPSRDEIADAMIAGNPDYKVTQVTEGERDWYLRDADAVLDLIWKRFEESK